MTQDEVAQKADIKRQYYNSLEAGGKGGKITFITAIKLQKALNLDLLEFYRLEQEYQKACERERKARKLKKSNIKEVLDIENSISSNQ
jgi:transcriptional regulator with XRE-family HTH domain